MNTAINIFMSILRNEQTNQTDFRKAAHTVAHLLAQQTLAQCSTQPLHIKTPFAQMQGVERANRIILVPILRSGITMLPAFLHYFEDALIGVIGCKRDKKTAQAHLYYSNIPPLHKDDQVIILDPMIATGGTALIALHELTRLGVAQNNIMFAAIVSAPEGLAAIKKEFPHIKLFVAAQDTGLDKNKLIVPGLGDFGDRFFGTVG